MGVPPTTVAATTPQRRPTDSRRGWVVLLWLQGAYYAVTGVWPLVSIRTFQWVTGPKTDHLPTGRESDHWLVTTVGVLVTVIAATLLISAWRKELPLAIPVLAIGSAAGLTAIDVVYVARSVIAPVYLLDALAEVVLILAWCFVLARGSAISRDVHVATRKVSR